MSDSNSVLSYTLSQTTTDAVREQDIISITGHRILRVNVFKDKDGQTQTLERINEQVDNILKELQSAKNNLIQKAIFRAWNIDTEYNPHTYITRGFIDLKDDVVLKKPEDVCNCFGYNYKGFQKGGAKHPYEEDTLIWLPRLYENKDWINTISDDGEIITERSTKETITEMKIKEWLHGRKKRIVFARVLDNLNARPVYRFMGLYELKSATIDGGAIWGRIATSVKTYSYQK